MTRIAVLLSVAALALAACAAGGASPSPTTAPTGAPTDAPTDAATDAAGDATVELASTDLGEIVVDGAGMTLYGFVPDEATGEPTCYEDCAANWPPLTVSGEFTVGEGLNQADFTTATRTDGATQLKLGTYPLYYFANDQAAGDTNGQGLNDVWFVIGADGELITD